MLTVFELLGSVLSIRLSQAYSAGNKLDVSGLDIKGARETTKLVDDGDADPKDVPVGESARAALTTGVDQESNSGKNEEDAGYLTGTQVVLSSP